MRKPHLLASILAIFFIILNFNSCVVVPNQYSSLAPGTWRAVLQIEPKNISENKKGAPLPEKMNMKFEEVSNGELPFVFEVIYDTDTSFHIEIINDTERIRVDDIKIGRDLKTAKDTIFINFPIYDSYIKGIYEEGILDGDWHVNYKENYSIPFHAFHGKRHRFTNLRKTPVIDMTGTWEIQFNDDDPYPAKGEFKQKGNHLAGTFLTETGDYRFLEGTIQADKFYLSCFDGAHAFLFEGKIDKDKETLLGIFRSGKHYKSTWEAKRNPNFSLKNPDSLTYLKPEYDKIAFSFKNPAGNTISLDSETYRNKVKIIQILGTWCPNCRDETTFLVNYLKEHPHPDLEVIAIAYERYRDESKSMDAIRRYKTHFDMNYEMVLGGYANKKEAAETLPMLNHILSYPTLIFVDKNDQVHKIHTGFAGPATSEYKAFQANFDKTVAKLLAN